MTRNLHLKIVFGAALCLLAYSALAQQVPASVEQRLAIQIANLSLQNAAFGKQIEDLQAENAKLKAELDALKKPPKK